MREASPDLSKDKKIKKQPAHEVFAYILHKRENNKVDYKTNIILSEPKKK